MVDQAPLGGQDNHPSQAVAIDWEWSGEDRDIGLLYRGHLLTPVDILDATVLQCILLHCTALHWTSLHCTALHCTALHCTALHCTVLLRSSQYCSKQDCHAQHYYNMTQYSYWMPSPRPEADLVRCYWSKERGQGSLRVLKGGSRYVQNPVIRRGEGGLIVGLLFDL